MSITEMDKSDIKVIDLVNESLNGIENIISSKNLNIQLDIDNDFIC
ncbi:MAG: hypothetical protein R2728_11270 [Chitinophagales bacterium]